MAFRSIGRDGLAQRLVLFRNPFLKDRPLLRWHLGSERATPGLPRVPAPEQRKGDLRCNRSGLRIAPRFEKFTLLVECCISIRQDDWISPMIVREQLAGQGAIKQQDPGDAAGEALVVAPKFA